MAVMCLKSQNIIFPTVKDEYEAKGEKKRAAEYYRKAAEFAQKSPGFDQELIDRYFSQAKLLESQE